MIKRTHYIEQIRPFFESDLIKVITGIRRCGKSVLMEQIQDEFRRQGKPTLRLNFEELATAKTIPDISALEDVVEKALIAAGNQKLYVFLDEVQNLPDWNIGCKSLRLKNLSLFITGSNSKLLSREFTKELSGRYISFRIRPFVYKELQEYAEQLKRQYSVTDYMIYGGFPKVIESETKAAVVQYLNELDQTIVMNDILNRYNIRKDVIFRRLVNFVLISNARILSANSILKFLKNEKLEVTLSTVLKYLSYLEEAYIISSVPQFSTKAKRELRYYTKIYNEDVAFNSIRQVDNRWDLTHNLENIIYNELLYRDYSLRVFRQGDLEIDFLAVKNGKEILIQVAYSIVEPSTYEREFALFNKLDNSRQKIIITNDDVDFSTSTVKHIRLRDFLLGDDL